MRRPFLFFLLVTIAGPVINLPALDINPEWNRKAVYSNDSAYLDLGPLPDDYYLSIDIVTRPPIGESRSFASIEVYSNDFRDIEDGRVKVPVIFDLRSWLFEYVTQEDIQEAVASLNIENPEEREMMAAELTERYSCDMVLEARVNNGDGDTVTSPPIHVISGW